MERARLAHPHQKKTKAALLIIDMLNTLAFPEGKALLKQALPAAKAISKLKDRLNKRGIPVIYVNDNFGQWRSDWKAVYKICAAPDSLGAPIARLLHPGEEDYFVLKPRHSGFFSTTLEVLLEELGARTLILTGVAGNICVLFTAHDAHMRGYRVIVPRDCIASNTFRDNQSALRQIELVTGSETKLSRKLRIVA